MRNSRKENKTFHLFLLRKIKSTKENPFASPSLPRGSKPPHELKENFLSTAIIRYCCSFSTAGRQKKKLRNKSVDSRARSHTRRQRERRNFSHCHKIFFHVSTREVFHSVIHKSIFKKHRRRYVDHHQEKGKHIKNMNFEGERKRKEKITINHIGIAACEWSKGRERERAKNSTQQHAREHKKLFRWRYFVRKKARISHLHKLMQNVL